jgi:hypothetical protein
MATQKKNKKQKACLVPDTSKDGTNQKEFLFG